MSATDEKKDRKLLHNVRWHSVVVVFVLLLASVLCIKAPNANLKLPLFGTGVGQRKFFSAALCANHGSTFRFSFAVVRVSTTTYTSISFATCCICYHILQKTWTDVELHNTPTVEEEVDTYRRVVCNSSFTLDPVGAFHFKFRMVSRFLLRRCRRDVKHSAIPVRLQETTTSVFDIGKLFSADPFPFTSVGNGVSAKAKLFIKRPFRRRQTCHSAAQMRLRMCYRQTLPFRYWTHGCAFVLVPLLLAKPLHKTVCGYLCSCV